MAGEGQMREDARGREKRGGREKKREKWSLVSNRGPGERTGRGKARERGGDARGGGWLADARMRWMGRHIIGRVTITGVMGGRRWRWALRANTGGWLSGWWSQRSDGVHARWHHGRTLSRQWRVAAHWWEDAVTMMAVGGSEGGSRRGCARGQEDTDMGVLGRAHIRRGGAHGEARWHRAVAGVGRLARRELVGAVTALAETWSWCARGEVG